SLVFFRFDCDASPPDRHPFPTRRSSDLYNAKELWLSAVPLMRNNKNDDEASSRVFGGAEQRQAGFGVQVHADRLCSMPPAATPRSEEHTSELQSRENLGCRLLLAKTKQK